MSPDWCRRRISLPGNRAVVYQTTLCPHNQGPEHFHKTPPRKSSLSLALTNAKTLFWFTCTVCKKTKLIHACTHILLLESTHQHHLIQCWFVKSVCEYIHANTRLCMALHSPYIYLRKPAFITLSLHLLQEKAMNHANGSYIFMLLMWAGQWGHLVHSIMGRERSASLRLLFLIQLMMYIWQHNLCTTCIFFVFFSVWFYVCWEAYAE